MVETPEALYDVFLVSLGPNPDDVARRLAQATGEPESVLRELLAHAPTTVLSRVTYSVAARIGMDLHGIGARTEARYAAGSAPSTVDNELSESFGDSLLMLSSCTFLGGHGATWEPGTSVRLWFGEMALAVRTGSTFEPFEYAATTEIELSGRGRLSKNARIIGGGFG